MKTFLLFSYFLLFSVWSFSQGNSLLWRISGGNLQHPSYLYGTMHSTDPRVFHFADSVLPVFEMCDAFAMEVLIDENTQATLLQNIFMKGDATLKSLLTSDQYDSVQRFAMKNAGLDVSYFDRMKPLYVAMMLDLMSGDDSLLNNADPFLDQYFENSARDQQKKLIGLETAGEQMAIFDVMTYKDQSQLLMKSIRDYSDDTTEFQDMIQSYLSNDLAKMMEFENDFSMPDSLYDALITNRNIKMAKRIDSLVQLQSTFIAVGAGHLGGTEGLIALLREKNYNVIPVLPTFSHFLGDGWIRFSSNKNKFVIDFPSGPDVTMDEQKNSVYASFIKTESGKKEFFKLMVTSSLNSDETKKFLSAGKSNFIFDEANKTFAFADDDGFKTTGKIIDAPSRTYILTDKYKQKPKFAERYFQSFSILAE